MDYLQEKIRLIPQVPGCYLWKDKDGSILYIGKAKKLRNRLLSYFNTDNIKTRYLMNRVENFECIITNTELEALLLENNLIKKHQPQFNIRLKDDKNYPYLALTVSEDFPRLILTRKKLNPSYLYFGPYSDVRAARSTKQLLEKVFPIRKRPLNLPLKKPASPCLNHHIGRCLAPCTNQITPQKYQTIVQQVKDYLEGHNSKLKKNLLNEMQSASKSLQYEKAAQLRDILADLELIEENQKVENLSEKTFDLIAVASSQLTKKIWTGQVVLLKVRHAKLIHKASYALTETWSDESPENKMLNSFLKEYYLNKDKSPLTVFTTFPVKFELVNQIKKITGKKINTDKIINKEVQSLLKIAEHNAKLSLKERLLQEELRASQMGMRQLMKFLKLPTLPKTIECYDISNFQGMQAVGARVTFKNGIEDKSGYRRYRIRFKDTPDDPAMMKEMLLRRFMRKDSMPNLIIIDGGITQIKAAIEARKKAKVTVKIIGLAKKREEIYTEEGKVLHFNPDSPGMLILRKARDEAHRFSVSYHRKLRIKKNLTSILEKIKGIGPKKQKTLSKWLSEMNIEKVKSIENEIIQLPGFNKKIAIQIKPYIEEILKLTLS